MSGSRIWATSLIAALLIAASPLVGFAGSGLAPCNAYYPVPAGATWTYREGLLGRKPRVEKLVTVVSVEGEGDRRKAMVEQSVRTPGAPGLAVGRARTTVHCDRGRIGMTVQGAAQANEAGRKSRGTVTAQIPGLPPAHRLVAGYEWTSKSVIKATDDDLQSVTEGTRESRVAGIERVTVPAGEFPRALKIVSTETLRQTGEGRSARQDLVEWYAKSVGLIKRETRVRSGANTATSVEVLVGSSLLPDR